VALGLLACSGGAGDGGPDGDVEASTAEAARATPPELARRAGNTPLTPEVPSSLDSEMNTLLLSAALADERVGAVRSPAIAERFERVSALTEQTQTALDALAAFDPDGASHAEKSAELERVGRLLAQLSVELRRIKQQLRASGVDRAAQPELFRGLDTLKLAARSLSARVAEARAVAGESALARLSAEEAEIITRHNGPLHPGSSWYVLDEGHIDAIDVAYEDDELGLSIHDESVDPDVERDPAETILVVKSSAKTQVPDERFAFLGPVGSNVWILPEGQPEAEAAGILWPGIATAEVEASVFVGDAIDIRFLGMVGPNGFSLFESPDDELSNPNVLVDSENGLPDTLTTPVGIHRHANWAFESPGLYLLRVQARGRLAELPGNPWVSSEDAVLKFIVLP
jgi:surface-anchored protein